MSKKKGELVSLQYIKSRLRKKTNDGPIIVVNEIIRNGRRYRQDEMISLSRDSEGLLIFTPLDPCISCGSSRGTLYGGDDGPGFACIGVVCLLKLLRNENQPEEEDDIQNN